MLVRLPIASESVVIFPFLSTFISSDLFGIRWVGARKCERRKETGGEKRKERESGATEREKGFLPGC